MSIEMGDGRVGAQLVVRAARTTDGRMPVDVLGAALALCLWIAFGSFVLAVVEGLGPHPTRRLLIGLVLVVVGVAAVALRARVSAGLQRRPWLVVPFAAVLLAVIAVDGVVGGPYVAVSQTAIGIAVVAARARTVWLCVVVLMAGYAIGVLVHYSPAELSRIGKLGVVIGALLGYPVAALLLMGLRRRFTRLVDRFEPTLDAIRHGSPSANPALERALRAQPIALPRASGREGATTPVLTAMERRVVQALAGGATPKAMAFDWGLSINTIRTHLRNAKRKTGARTLRELATMPAHLDWVSDPDD